MSPEDWIKVCKEMEETQAELNKLIGENNRLTEENKFLRSLVARLPDMMNRGDGFVE